MCESQHRREECDCGRDEGHAHHRGECGCGRSGSHAHHGGGHGRGCCCCRRCCCACRGGGGWAFPRRFRSRQEQVAELEAYLQELEAEAQGVREALAGLRSQE